MLIEKLNEKLNSSVHNHIDLNLREISSEQGSLCGMAAIYQALGDTLLTRSQVMCVYVFLCFCVCACVCVFVRRAFVYMAAIYVPGPWRHPAYQVSAEGLEL